jgi:hypothetical protein
MQFSRFAELRIPPTNSLKLTVSLSVLSLVWACVYSACQMPAVAKSAPRNISHARSSDGVTVRKNADGTVESFDAGSAPEPLTQYADQTAAHARRPIVSRAYSRVIGGVHVKRNSDGTVETYEAPSRPVNLYPSVRSSKSPRHSK